MSNISNLFFEFFFDISYSNIYLEVIPRPSDNSLYFSCPFYLVYSHLLKHILFYLERPVLYPALVVEELGGGEDHSAHDGSRRWGRLRGNTINQGPRL